MKTVKQAFIDIGFSASLEDLTSTADSWVKKLPKVYKPSIQNYVNELAPIYNNRDEIINHLDDMFDRLPYCEAEYHDAKERMKLVDKTPYVISRKDFERRKMNLARVCLPKSMKSDWRVTELESNLVNQILEIEPFEKINIQNPLMKNPKHRIVYYRLGLITFSKEHMAYIRTSIKITPEEYNALLDEHRYEMKQISDSKKAKNQLSPRIISILKNYEIGDRFTASDVCNNDRDNGYGYIKYNLDKLTKRGFLKVVDQIKKAKVYEKLQKVEN